TLLHYCGSNGVETYRQVVPTNLPQLTQLLIDAGADVNATAEMYGGNCPTLGLLITSAHPAEAGVVDQVVQILIDAGAYTDDS
ncbi:MAG: ankyrin repeat domain-containing protein, partial [Pirellulaceae bacterium]|nr:ankyrin repeat domain-containing protein [Pirellulaceae bacterium]